MASFRQEINQALEEIAQLDTDSDERLVKLVHLGLKCMSHATSDEANYKKEENYYTLLASSISNLANAINNFQRPTYDYLADFVMRRIKEKHGEHLKIEFLYIFDQDNGSVFVTCVKHNTTIKVPLETLIDCGIAESYCDVCESDKSWVRQLKLDDYEASKK